MAFLHNKAFILFSILTTHFISYSIGSKEAQAIQLTLSRAVAGGVARTCPGRAHKFDEPSKRWKSEAKELVRSKIRDLSRFEPDEATVNAYTTWICSGGGGRSVFYFPPLSEIGFPRPEIATNDVSEESSLDQTSIEDNFEFTGETSATPFEFKIIAISFLLGCLIGVLIMHMYAFRSVQPMSDTKKLRRPEL